MTQKKEEKYLAAVVVDGNGDDWQWWRQLWEEGVEEVGEGGGRTWKVMKIEWEGIQWSSFYVFSHYIPNI